MDLLRPMALVAAAIVLAAAPAAAAPRVHVDLDVNAFGGVTLQGAWSGTASLGGIAHRAGDGSAAGSSAILHVTNARVLLLHDTISLSDTLNIERQFTDEDFQFTGTIAIKPLDGPTFIQLLPYNLDGVLSTNLTSPIAWKMFGPPSIPSAGFVPLFENRAYVAYNDGPNVRSPVKSIQTQGGLAGVAYTATVQLEGSSTRTLTTGDETTYSTTPLPNKEFSLTTRRYIIFQAQDADATMTGDWSLDVKALDGKLTGGLAIAGVNQLTGRPTLPADKATLVQLDGAVHLASQYSGTHDSPTSASTWHVKGEATMLGIDGEAVDLARLSPETVAIGGLSILAVLASLFKNQIAAFLAGYVRANPLEHETRKQMLELITAQPGITRSELRARLKVHQTTIAFHAQVLANAQLVRRHGGKPVHYSIMEADARADAALTHAVRRGIHNILGQASAPLSSQAIQDALAAQGLAVSPRLFQWHMKILLQAHVVVRQGMTRKIAYHLTSRPALPNLASSTTLPERMSAP